MTSPRADTAAGYVRWRDAVERRPIDLTVVIPAYNEQSRIVPTIGAFAAHLGATGLAWELVVSDDGSTDHTCRLLELLDHANIRVVGDGTNRGKGAAVREGMLAARGRLVLFADADNAAPAQELDALLAAVRAGADVAIGSRCARGARAQNRSRLRSALTAGLRRIVRWTLRVPVEDTQCGFKLLTAEAARRVAAAQTVDGFAFDLELLFLAERIGYRIAEVPVRWFDAPGSTVDPVRDVARFLVSIARIRWNALTGVYRDA